ncbi:glycosyltransferase [Limosilactobacillus pontis]|uniref:glycosyltransferase family 32 protein n=1 Tax=Limosilactobacillus pontis TaxID=35787 RepID=UPI002F2664B1
MQIPKTIHYIWLGGEKPDNVRNTIKSWNKRAPKFEIKEWSERDLNILYQNNDFYKQALDDGNYSYASDVARLYILKRYGGIYMDTDEILLKSPEGIIRNRELVLGLQEPAKEFMITAFIAAIPEQNNIVAMLDKYQLLSYNRENLIPNSEFFGPLLFEKFHLKKTNVTQTRCNGKIIFYEPNVLYQTSFHSTAIHIGMKSWGSKTRHDKFRIEARKHIHNRCEAGIFRIFNDVARKLIPDNN